MIKLRAGKVNRSFKGNVVSYVFLFAVGAFMALPMIYVINVAFKPLDELWLFPPNIFVRNPTLKNFEDMALVLSSLWIPFSKYVTNTILIVVLGIFFHVTFCTVAAYPLAKHDFLGKKFLNTMIVLSLMFSAKVTQIPIYLVMSKIGWIDSLQAVILPVIQSSLGLYLMRQFMVEGVPDSVVESAKLDGANELQIIFKIAMPLVKPAWLTLIVLMLPGLWNTTGGLYIYSEQLKPMSVAFGQIATSGIARQGAGAAAGLIMLSVPIIAFIITQSNIIDTMGSSGIKE